MSWLLSALGGLGKEFTITVLALIGFFLNYITKYVFKDLVMPLLGATIFQPFTLDPSTVVGRAANVVWATMAMASGGVALLMVLYGTLSRTAFALSGQRSWQEIGEGLSVWAAVTAGGWGFLNLLLWISNAGTTALTGSIQQSANVIFNTNGLAFGAAAAGATVFTELLWPLSGIAIAALAIWAVGVWLMRQVDLVLYAGLLPVMAALGVGGNKTPFKWAWSEAMGAVFNQLAMALVMWVGFQFLTNVHPVSILQQFEALFLAVTTFTLTARAPQMLRQITGHQSAGTGHLLTGMALGYLGGRGLESAARATPMGQALGMSMQGRESTARAAVTSWAGRTPLGERLRQTSVGQTVSRRLGAAASAVGTAVTSTSLGQSLQAMAQTHPGAAAVVRQGVSGATRPVRTLASFAYQPMSTLGHMASKGTADSSPAGPSGLIARSQDATVLMAQKGVQTAAESIFQSGGVPAADAVQQLGHLVNATIGQTWNLPDTGEQVILPVGQTPPKGAVPVTDPRTGGQLYQPQFAQGAWQAALYQNTRTSVLQNIPVTTDGFPTYHVDHPGRKAGDRGSLELPG